MNKSALSENLLKSTSTAEPIRPEIFTEFFPKINILLFLRQDVEQR